MNKQMGTITIFQIEDLNSIPGMSECINELKSLVDIQNIEKEHPAAIGELAGLAQELIMSAPIQLTLQSVMIAEIISRLISITKRAGKKLHISKNIAGLLMAAETLKTAKSEAFNEEFDPGKVVIYGPMEAEPKVGFSEKSMELWNVGLSEIAYFMGVIVARPKNRVKTYWYVYSASGEISASWTTQTLLERMPDFLNPHK